MPQLVSVRFRYNPKPLWFDPQDEQYKSGSMVLVETERGREVGTIYEASIDATDKQVKKLKSPLKPVIRELTYLDFEHLEALEEKGRSAMPYFREKIEEYELDIKPVEVQYVFSGERAVFYFSSEERVDFRDLVRDLAQHFHVRIDMRQIGARDEAKELGGLAHCGEEFCCTRFGGEFQPVSIRMAKDQDLPLNPAKISGACGRLMCCLRYEHEVYKDFKKRAPKKGTVVETHLGAAVISGYNTPSETMEIMLEDGNKINVPLAEMECQKAKDGSTHCSVSPETIERCATRSMLMSLGALEYQLDDEVMQATSVFENDLGLEVKAETRKRRRRGAGRTEATDSAGSSLTKAGVDKASPAKASPAKASPVKTGPAKIGSAKTKPGAAQKTSLLPETPAEHAPDTGRRRRRRSSGELTPGTTQVPQRENPVRPAADVPSGSRKPAEPAPSRKEKPRPGRRSSGLRRQNNPPAEANRSEASANRTTATEPNATRSDGARRRRRHTAEGTDGN